MNRIKFGKPLIGNAARTDVGEILKRRALTNAGKVVEFEERFAEAIGGGRAVAVSSCTAALHMAMMACGIGPGDEVIVPAQTFVASSHVVEAVGAKPVFVDVWPESGSMDPNRVEAAITKKTKAVMPVHFAGRPCYMGSIMDIARRHNLRVIEDCATALGAVHSGRHVGLIGDIGCFSFHPVKHITTCEGGMLVSRDFELAETARRMREFGKTQKDPYRELPGEYDIVSFGLNYRMTEMQAALGIHQLADASKRLLVRKSNYKLLKGALKDFEVLDLGNGEAAAYCLIVMLPDFIDRRALRDDMAAWNVETSIYYPGPVPLMTYYREKYGYKPGDFPASERIADHSVALPVGPHLGTPQMAQIATAFKVAFAKQEKVRA
jgi:dTDP-4-amino-4,6-dideoxygalactose transaminase